MAELCRYFDDLAQGRGRIPLKKIEDVLISLEVVQTRRQVRDLTAALSDDATGELDFDQFLMLVLHRLPPETLVVFKKMMNQRLQGTDRDYESIIMEHRRKLIMDATGGGDRSEEARIRGCRFLDNFLSLQKQRRADAKAMGEQAPEEAIMFNPADIGDIGSKVGGLEDTWRYHCYNCGIIMPVHVLGVVGDKEAKTRTEVPLSPRAIIRNVLKPKLQDLDESEEESRVLPPRSPQWRSRHTIMLREDSAGETSSLSLHL